MDCATKLQWTRILGWCLWVVLVYL